MQLQKTVKKSSQKSLKKNKEICQKQVYSDKAKAPCRMNLQGACFWFYYFLSSVVPFLNRSQDFMYFIPK